MAGLGGAAAMVPLTLLAQKQPTLIGLLGSGLPQSSAIFVNALKEGLRDYNLSDGRDYLLVVRWAEGHYERFPQLVRDLVSQNPRMIIVTTVAGARAAQRATATIPLIMTTVTDPVGMGLVNSLARPGGNITGVSPLNQDVTPKLVEILHEIFPKATAIAALVNPTNPATESLLEAMRTQTALIGAKLYPFETKVLEDIEAEFERIARTNPDVLLIVPDAFILDQRALICELALRYRIALISTIPEMTDVGGLIAYGAPRIGFYRRAGYFVRRILDGANPADLPVEQPTRIEFSINLKTAKVVGVAIPNVTLVRADRVIE
jgi:putative ABC transport system substrate-binding protein